ncbi:MAG: DUF4956 domain-containing protein [Clostridia bacterium]|nr:DUF4956 domain-containing protein [Clostridia bacterium]
MFDSIFQEGEGNAITTGDIFLALGVALLAGIVFATMCFYKTRSTKSFLMATALLPMVVALVIILVNGNIGAGVAIAGAFSLVRFRSAPGTAKEICIIFISMAAGLAFGMGYLAYGAIFMVGAGAALMVCETFKIWERKPVLKEKNVRITIPENLDYPTVFNDIFEKYTEKYEMVKMKTTNMGSMFRVDYHIVMKDVTQEREMVDELRMRNGNLEVIVQRTDYTGSEL